VDVPMEPPGAAGAGGAGPTGNPQTQMVALDPNEDFLLAANYNPDASYVYVYRLNGDGTVGDITDSALDGESSHQIVFVPGLTNGSMLVPYRVRTWLQGTVSTRRMEPWGPSSRPWSTPTRASSTPAASGVPPHRGQPVLGLRDQ